MCECVSAFVETPPDLTNSLSIHRVGCPRQHKCVRDRDSLLAKGETQMRSAPYPGGGWAIKPRNPESQIRYSSKFEFLAKLQTNHVLLSSFCAPHNPNNPDVLQVTLFESVYTYTSRITYF